MTQLGLSAEGPCIITTWPTHGQGYGRLNNTFAHRAAWQAAMGPIPEGAKVLHRCDNPPCIRPDHLFLGTQAENNKDRSLKGRTRTGTGDAHGSKTHPDRVPRGDRHKSRTMPEALPRGEGHGMAMLNDKQVVVIKAQLRAGVRQVDLARFYGVSKHVIHLIAKGRTWRHIP